MLVLAHQSGESVIYEPLLLLKAAVHEFIGTRDCLMIEWSEFFSTARWSNLNYVEILYIEMIVEIFINTRVTDCYAFTIHPS